MGDPATFSLAVGALTSVAGTGLELSAEIQESDARRNELRNNARLADLAATDATSRGMSEAGKQRMAGSQLVAKQFVGYANSGVDPTQGTAARTQEWTRAVSELDAQTLQNNAAREAWGFKTKANEMRTEEVNERRRSENRRWGTVLGGVGRLAGQFGSYAGNKR